MNINLLSTTSIFPGSIGYTSGIPVGAVADGNGQIVVLCTPGPSQQVAAVFPGTAIPEQTPRYVGAVMTGNGPVAVFSA